MTVLRRLLTAAAGLALSCSSAAMAATGVTISVIDATNAGASPATSHEAIDD